MLRTIPNRPMNEEALDQARSAPALQRIGAAAGSAGLSAYLVGGAVRDALLGLPVGDLDVCIEGDVAATIEMLGASAISHPRFGTASLEVEGRRVDLARSRRESYPEPGALPVVEPAAIRADLARRDFTINAMAVPLAGELELLDPYDGAVDLERGLLRVLHDASFADDPTRALRAARYAARLDLALEAGTEEALRAADLGTVSIDRIAAEWRRIAAEPSAVEAFGRLAEWRLAEFDAEALSLAARVDEVASGSPWDQLALRTEALIESLGAAGLQAELDELTGFEPASPSEGVEFASRWERRPVVLLIARAAGAEWLDRWLSEWSRVRLSITGSELIERGVLAGPAMGRALQGTLARVLDGELGDDPAEQLEVALEIAAQPDPPGAPGPA